MGEVPALVRHSSTMQPDLEPIEPQQALELYLTDRRGELRESTIRSHRSRLSIFIDWCRETEGINNLNDSPVALFTGTKCGDGPKAISTRSR